MYISKIKYLIMLRGNINKRPIEPTMVVRKYPFPINKPNMKL